MHGAERRACALRVRVRRCVEPDCRKGAQGPSGKCVAHGGGKRCAVVGQVCTKLALDKSGMCGAHGGGKR